MLYGTAEDPHPNLSRFDKIHFKCDNENLVRELNGKRRLH